MVWNRTLPHRSRMRFAYPGYAIGVRRDVRARPACCTQLGGRASTNTKARCDEPLIAFSSGPGSGPLQSRTSTTRSCMSPRKRCLLLLAFLVPAAQAAEVPAPLPTTVLDTVVVSGKQPGPGLWKVSNDDHVMWVLGTISPLPKRME